ncbi:hypothetical protein PF005_g14094 [Phytophthora fragariae]|uniref:Retrotransposon gag domain-containing protein n=3 Tax=Phytophthora fragariae TaxID=53985 RepID=A0A6A4CN38_9STRA|nr:hypothetical protein PF003_g17521 [Phytophthora fragariae]KAE9093120.1 hypothetical protein PF010_g17612 [Phytophthora fragariae]KAE9203657.1 hypothetical protein PF005_g14094 [Phytophthora fragariae]KAE9220980.1 hypothetical protein PF002_g15719 [Phytophthora fragariae]KAE9293787.1 hypothetical protein PF001_g18094 [Phytophthora fragariae]
MARTKTVVRSSLGEVAAGDTPSTSSKTNEDEAKTEERPPMEEENAAAPSTSHDAGRSDQEQTSEATRPVDGGSASNPSTVGTEPVAVLAAVIQQLLTTVNRLETRMGRLETTAPPGSSAPMAPTAMRTAPPTVAETLAATLSRIAATEQTRTTSATTPVAPRAAATSGRPPRGGRHVEAGHGDDDPSDSSEFSTDSYGSGSGSSSDDGHARRHRGRRQRRRRPSNRRTPSRRDRRYRRRERKNAKELDLQPFKHTAGGVRVETWIAKVDLAVVAARISRRGDWNDEELYYVVGNKLQDDAAKSWVQIDKELVGHERTWSKLKEALVRRYGERSDLAQAEWKVMQRTMQPGETFADFASGLQDAAGQNRVREETLLGQFYRGLEMTTRQLVKLAPTPTTLGEAVDKATKIDDSSYNVARGMRNIGQPWATSTTQTAIQMDGTTGAMRVIPGIGSMPADMMGDLTVGGNEVGE